MNTRQQMVLKAAKRLNVKRIKRAGVRQLYKDVLSLVRTVEAAPETKQGVYKIIKDAKTVLMYAERLPDDPYSTASSLKLSLRRLISAARDMIAHGTVRNQDMPFLRTVANNALRLADRLVAQERMG